MLRTRRTAASVLAAATLGGALAAGAGASWTLPAAAAGAGLTSVSDTGWDSVHDAAAAGRTGPADTGWDSVHTGVLAASDAGRTTVLAGAGTRPTVTFADGRDTGWD